MSRGTLDTSLPLSFSRTGLLPSVDAVFHPLIPLSLKVISLVRNPVLENRLQTFSEQRFMPLFEDAFEASSYSLLPVFCPLFSSTVWPPPRSLTTTCGISVDFFSCGYLDVSVPHVSPRIAMNSLYDTWVFTPGGFPHSEICGSQAICASPQLIAACHVLRRLLVPRHPPCALSSLTYKVSPLSWKNMSQHIRFLEPAMPQHDRFAESFHYTVFKVLFLEA